MFFTLSWVDIAMIVTGIIIVILVALQTSKDDLGSALTGGNSELFKQQKERGPEVYIVRATYLFSFAFMILAALNFIGVV